MTTSTTLKLPDELKARIGRIAQETGRTPHGVMIVALEREVSRAERMLAFVNEARAADSAIEAGASVYRAEDVHAWLAKRVTNPKAARPKPWRK
ncbi:MAG: hypothetical protein O2975_06050 [Proteobacteria bacterium]|nr:hypothetical protein [Pseudomonadota bacterium]